MTTEPPKTPNQDAQDAAMLAGLTAGLKAALGSGGGSGGPTDTSTSSSQTSITKLTSASAKAMLEAQAKTSGYAHTFTTTEIAQFIKEFDAEQSKQIQKIVSIARSKVTPGATSEALNKVVESVARQEFPSFFKPDSFASDYIWNKVNFGDSTTLSGTNLAILEKVRAVVKDFRVLGYSDAEAMLAAKKIAKGEDTLEGFTTKLQQVAIKEYPQFADRFSQDPLMTTKKIADPIINMLADLWEVPADTVGMDNPIVQSWLHPGGADGKQPQMSYYDAVQRGMNDPKNELSTKSNQNARDAATGLASAFGFGV